jgi:Immunoglobulin I-set domain
MEKPVLLKKPDDQEVTEGDDVYFKADVTGIPDPTVSW